jgi:hypothetical protein
MGGKMSTLRYTYLLDHGGDPGIPDVVGDTPVSRCVPPY